MRMRYCNRRRQNVCGVLHHVYKVGISRVIQECQRVTIYGASVRLLTGAKGDGDDQMTSRQRTRPHLRQHAWSAPHA